MNVLITGVAGFIGSSIAEELLKNSSINVIGLDNMSNGSYENISILRAFTNFQFIESDIRDIAILSNIMKNNNIRYIYHLAAIASVQESISNPVMTGSVNVQGTLNILEAARRNNVHKIIFSSSAAVYGDEPSLPKNEISQTAPISPYGYEKLMGEYYMKLYNNLYGIETVILRYFNVYGKRQNLTSEYSGVISKFIANFNNNETSKIYGTGNQYRDFVYIDDVVQANILAMNTPNIGGEVFCVGSSHKTTVNKVFDLLQQKYKKSFSPHYQPMIKGDIQASVCDNSKIKNVLKMGDFTLFEKGIMQL